MITECFEPIGVGGDDHGAEPVQPRGRIEPTEHDFASAEDHSPHEVQRALQLRVEMCLLLTLRRRLLSVRAWVLRELRRGSVVPLLGSRRVRLLRGVTNVPGICSGARAYLTDASAAAAAQYSEYDNGANYGSEADHANH
jgi:hypothetical protein